MSLIRPNAARQLKRWAEPGIAVLFCAGGVWLALTGLGIFRWFGVLLAIVSTSFALLAIRRAMFWGGEFGVGHVEVDEGEIRYMAARGGASLPISALRSVRLTQQDRGPRLWSLSGAGMPPLWIPVDASGAQALFDVFANLPGMDMQALLRHLNRPQGNDVVIWQRNAARLH